LGFIQTQKVFKIEPDYGRIEKAKAGGGLAE
jgi:hypothetical protein